MENHGVLIDLGLDPAARQRTSPPAGPGQHGPRQHGLGQARPMMGRRTPAFRFAVMLALAFAAALPPATALSQLSEGRPIPLPSFCTGAPIPGGRLNIVQDDTFTILDATTNTVVNTGRCPHGTGTRTNTGN
jgi:hypothetical protein